MATFSTLAVTLMVAEEVERTAHMFGYEKPYWVAAMICAEMVVALGGVNVIETVAVVPVCVLANTVLGPVIPPKAQNCVVPATTVKLPYVVVTTTLLVNGWLSVTNSSR